MISKWIQTWSCAGHVRDLMDDQPKPLLAPKFIIQCAFDLWSHTFSAVGLLSMTLWYTLNLHHAST
jgi:hypothetical protein